MYPTPVSAKPSAMLRDVISLMDKHGYKEIPVIDGNNKVLGIVSYFDILNLVRFRGDSKAVNFMHSAHTVNEKDDEASVLNLMVNCGSTGFPVINKHEKIVGFVSDYDLLDYYKNVEMIKKINIGDAGIHSVPSIAENANLGEVRNIMNFNKKDRLPVVDEKGKFSGTIVLLDILRKYYTDAPDKIGRNAFKSDIQKIMDYEIKGLIRDEEAVTVSASLKDSINKMLEMNSQGLIIVNSFNEPIGFLGRCDVLKKIHDLVSSKEMNIIIAGELPANLTSQVKSIILSSIKTQAGYYNKIKEVKLFMKRIHDSRSEGKVEMHLTIERDGKDINIKKNGFDILLTLADCLDTANQLLKQEWNKTANKI